MRNLVVCILLASLFLPACTNSTAEITNPIRFPEKVPLTYEKVEWEPLDDSFEVHMMEWDKLKSTRFGEVHEESVGIDLYANQKESNDVIGVLQYKNKSYLVERIGYRHDMEAIETYRIQMNYNDGFQLIGAIGSPALGYKYILYHVKNKEWFTIHHWGIPILIDMNQDGNDELFMQFQGKGLNFPDLHIWSWQSEGFQVASINASIQQIMDWDDPLSIQMSSTIGDTDDLIIKVELMGEMQATAHYTYKAWDGLLLQQ